MSRRGTLSLVGGPLLAPVLALVLAPRPALAQLPVPLKEWTVPYEKSRPRDPAVAPDGRIFFVGQVGNYVASLDPRTGAFRKYELDPGTLPHNCIVDARGLVWFAGNRNGIIGRLDPAKGVITRYPMPDTSVKDPHTLVFDRAGDIWFTAQFSNVVGKLDVKRGTIALVKMPAPQWRPYGIVIDSKNVPWFVLFGTNKIGTIEPKGMVLRTFDLADARTRPRRIAITSDDKLWYVDYSRGFLGRLDPATGGVTEHALPGGPASLPYAMASDDKDRIWLVETGKQPNRFVGFDPRTGQFFANSAVESGGGTIRHMVFDRKTGLIWFGSDNNTIGRATVGELKPAM